MAALAPHGLRGGPRARSKWKHLVDRRRRDFAAHDQHIINILRRLPPSTFVRAAGELARRLSKRGTRALVVVRRRGACLPQRAPSAASFFCCVLINSSRAWISWSRALPLGCGASTGPSIEIWAKDLSCLPAVGSGPLRPRRAAGASLTVSAVLVLGQLCVGLLAAYLCNGDLACDSLGE